MNTVIDWNDVEVGQTLQYEEGYHTQAEVEVVDKTYSDDQKFLWFELKITNARRGCKFGDTIHVGKSLRDDGSYLTAKMKFKPLGSGYDYV